MTRISLLAFTAGVLFSALNAPAATIFATELFGIADPNAFGPNSTYALGLNDSNQVAGYYVASNGLDRIGFLDSGGIYTDISFPGANGTYATGINDLGQIVGSYSSAGQWNAFLYSGGSYTTLNLPYSMQPTGLANSGVLADSFAFLGINDSGEIIGTYADSNGVNHGFDYSLSTDTVIQTIDFPGAVQRSGEGTIATGIDNNGDVIGYYLANSGFVVPNSFLVRHGVYSTIDTGFPISIPRGINDRGDIVGENITDVGALFPTDTGFLNARFGEAIYDQVIELPANALVGQVNAINDSGDVVTVDGASVSCCSSDQGIAPEPSSVALLLIGACATLASRVLSGRRIVRKVFGESEKPDSIPNVG